MNTAYVRRLMLGRLRGNPRGRITQGKLDCFKGKLAQFEVTGLTLADVLYAFGVATFKFSGIPVTQMLLRFSPAGFVFLLQLVVRAYLLEAQRAAAEEFVLTQFGKTPAI